VCGDENSKKTLFHKVVGRQRPSVGSVSAAIRETIPDWLFRNRSPVVAAQRPRQLRIRDVPSWRLAPVRHPLQAIGNTAVIPVEQGAGGRIQAPIMNPQFIFPQTQLIADQYLSSRPPLTLHQGFSVDHDRMDPARGGVDVGVLDGIAVPGPADLTARQSIETGRGLPPGSVVAAAATRVVRQVGLQHVRPLPRVRTRPQRLFQVVGECVEDGIDGIIHRGRLESIESKSEDRLRRAVEIKGRQSRGRCHRHEATMNVFVAAGFPRLQEETGLSVRDDLAVIVKVPLEPVRQRFQETMRRGRRRRGLFLGPPCGGHGNAGGTMRRRHDSWNPGGDLEKRIFFYEEEQ
jgi:hypothetical protein